MKKVFSNGSYNTFFFVTVAVVKQAKAICFRTMKFASRDKNLRKE